MRSLKKRIVNDRVKKKYAGMKNHFIPLAIGVGLFCGSLFPATAQALLVDGPGLAMIIDGSDLGDRVSTFNIDGTLGLSTYDFGFIDAPSGGFIPITLGPVRPVSAFGSYRFDGGVLVDFALRETASGLIYSMADPLDYADQIYLNPIDPAHSVNPSVSYTYYSSLLLEWDLDLNGVMDVGYTLTTAQDSFDGLAPAPVPIPAAFILFGSGLAGLGVMWKRFAVRMMS